ncbi:MAG: hypothetical protein JWN04_1875 [Myxococcaceae bacterium]|nr:hypothetical protein [Myxococcaceae bacterium]
MVRLREGALVARLFGAWLVILTASSAALVNAARAEAPAAESAEYRTTIQRAVQEFEAGNYAEARGLFVHAHELYPNARTLRGLGLVAFELRNYGVCVDNLQAALKSTEKPLTTEQRSNTEETLARARAFIARVNVNVSPETARVLVDGMPVELAKGQALVLEVGDHVVEIQAAGYLPERRSLSIAGGEQLKLSVVMHQPEQLAAGGNSAAPLAGPHDDGPSRRRWYKSPWLWSGVAVVAVGIGAGLAFALRPDAKNEPRDPTTTGNTPKGGTLQALGSW